VNVYSNGFSFIVHLTPTPSLPSMFKVSVNVEQVLSASVYWYPQHLKILLVHKALHASSSATTPSLMNLVIVYRSALLHDPTEVFHVGAFGSTAGITVLQ